MTEEYDSPQEYIQEVKNINHMNQDLIYEGSYLCVPYYSSEIKIRRGFLVSCLSQWVKYSENQEKKGKHTYESQEGYFYRCGKKSRCFSIHCNPRF